MGKVIVHLAFSLWPQSIRRRVGGRYLTNLAPATANPSVAEITQDRFNRVIHRCRGSPQFARLMVGCLLGSDGQERRSTAGVGLAKPM